MKNSILNLFKYGAFVLLFTSIFACQNSDAQEELKGIYVDFSGLDELPKRPIVIQKINEQLTAEDIDTVTLDAQKNFYVIQQADTTESFFKINFDNQSSKFIIARQKDTVHLVHKDLFGQRIISSKGSYGTAQLEKYQQMRGDFQVSTQSINVRYGEAAKQGNDALMKQLELEYMDQEDAFEEKIKNEVLNSKWSIANLFGIEPISIDRHFPAYEKVYEKYKGKTGYDLKISNLVENSRAVAIGAMAPEITLPDTEGKERKLSEMRGNYVLIDFWAAWCGPCRRENPNVKAVYNDFKDKGFKVVGVSLDRTEDQWRKAIKKDGLPWLQLSAINDQKPSIDYRVTGIPLSVLVDPQGVIVGKNLRGARLRRKISSLYN